jgi:hypothetical protein
MSAQNRVSRSLLDRRPFLGARAGVADPDDQLRTQANERPLRAVIERPVLTFLLLLAAQFTDLFTFGMAVDKWGPSGELGPLGVVYAHAGILAVALVKMGLVAVVLTILACYPWQRAATPRRLALIVAAIGVFGAFTNVAALI